MIVNAGFDLKGKRGKGNEKEKWERGKGEGEREKWKGKRKRKWKREMDHFHTDDWGFRCSNAHPSEKELMNQPI